MLKKIDVVHQVIEYINVSAVTITTSETEVGAVVMTTAGGLIRIIGKIETTKNTDAMTYTLRIRRGPDVAGAELDRSEVTNAGGKMIVRAVDDQLPGTYTYKLWANQSGGGKAEVSHRNFTVKEMKRRA